MKSGGPPPVGVSGVVGVGGRLRRIWVESEFKKTQVKIYHIYYNILYEYYMTFYETLSHPPPEPLSRKFISTDISSYFLINRVIFHHNHVKPRNQLSVIIEYLARLPSFFANNKFITRQSISWCFPYSLGKAN